MIDHPFESNIPYVLLTLNYHLPKFFDNIWNNAKIKICVDGGANQVYDFFLNKGIKEFNRPDIVIGNLKSIKKDIKDFFKFNGTQFLELHNSEINDSEKSINFLDEMKIKDPIILLGALGGKMDQSTSIFHSMLLHSNLNLNIIDDNNFCKIILPGNNIINFKNKWTTKICGLLPIFKPIKNITTKGLKWNLNNDSLKIGNFISTSNEILNNKIEIFTSDPILWTNQSKKKKLIF